MSDREINEAFPRITEKALDEPGQRISDVDTCLNDPAFFAGDRHYALFDRMRREDPVHWTASPDGRGYWSLFRHADVKHVLNEPTLFSSEREGVFPVLDEEMAKISREAWGVGENVLMMDPPRHAEFRKVIAQPFLPKALSGNEPRTKKLIGQIFDALPAHGEIDLVKDLAVRIPMAVICDVLDLPEEDWNGLIAWGQLAIGGSDPEYSRGSAAETMDYGYQCLKAYADKIINARRGCPHHEPIGMLANATVDGRPMTHSEAIYNAVQLLLAGFETTRSAFAGGVLALLQNPEQMAKLRADPKLLRLATEEFVRWSNPGISIMRVATADTEIAGRKIRANDRVILWLASANRDEEVFERPYEFDVTRHPNLHLGFGAGPHFCLGGPLAKLEIKVAMEELLERYEGIEITGPVEWVQTAFVGGLKRLPVRLKAKAQVAG